MRARRAILSAACAFALSIVGLMMLGSCGGSGDLPLDQVDPAAAPADPTYDQVHAILHNRCVSCHTADDDDDDDDGDYAVDPRRAVTGDVEPNLDDCIQIVAFRDDILEQVESNTMPPGAMPRLTSEQKLLIQRWVENGAPAPCN